MSQIPTYVQSQSGTWYKNPVIRSDKWFVCWDDNEPIELVVRDHGPRIEGIIADLCNAGWAVTKCSVVRRSLGRYFDRMLAPARSCFLLQVNRGPPDELLEGNTIEAPHPDCVCYHDKRGNR